MRSLSVVEVKVKESPSVDKYVSVSDSHRPPEVCAHTQEVVVPMASVLDPPSPPNAENDPSSPSSCVSTSPVHELQQLSVEASLSDSFGDVLQETAAGPRNLRSKRIRAFWRERSEVGGPTPGQHSSIQKRKKKGYSKADDRNTMATHSPTQRKQQKGMSD